MKFIIVSLFEFFFAMPLFAGSSLISIETILDLLNHIPKNVPKERILICLDWDLTISRFNGTAYPYREDDYTESVLLHLKNERYNYIVLTARLFGYSIDDGSHIVDGFELSRDQILGSGVFGDISSKTIFNSPHDEVYFYMAGTKTKCTRSYSIVFAGNKDGQFNAKTEAILHHIDNGYFLNQPEYILFLDDVLEYHLEMVQAFMDRPEKLISLYYPISENIPK